MVSLQLARAKKPYSDGNEVKMRAIEMAKAFGYTSIVQKLESLSLSNQSLQRRVIDTGKQVTKKCLA